LFQVEDEQIHCNRYVLALHSPVFEKMFTVDMKEKATNVCHIEEFDKVSVCLFGNSKLYTHYEFQVRAMLKYMYSGWNYDKMKPMAGTLYMLAHKYEIKGLIQHVTAVFLADINEENVCMILKSAHLTEYAKSGFS
jgi:hypothetical protein